MLKALLTVLAVLLLLPAAASAASTAAFTPREVIPGEEESPEPSFLEVTGDAGVNNLTLTVSGNTATIADTSGVTAGDNCTSVDATHVTCPKPDTTFVDAGAGNDRVVAGAVLGADVDGGPGGDIIASAGQINGDDGADLIGMNSPEGGQLLDGGAGRDRIFGNDGPDRIFGGHEDDFLDAGSGNDRLNGDEASGGAFGSDTLIAGAGVDTLAWDGRTASVSVNLSDNAPDGEPGENDRLSGFERVATGAGDDTLVGTDGPETFFPGGGTDNVLGGGGNDRVTSSPGNDSFDLGAGRDTISFASSSRPVTVNLADAGRDGAKGSLDALKGIENVLGSQPEDNFKGDTLIGDGTANVLEGLGGSDRVFGRGGRDKLYGESRPADTPDASPADGVQIDLSYPAVDRLHGGGGRDLLFGGIDGDFLDGGSAHDRLVGELGPGFNDGEGRSAGSKDIADYSSRRKGVRARVGKGGGGDSYSGLEGIRGGRGSDVLTGRRGKADILRGGRGRDRLNGLTGKDRLFGDRGRDFLKAKDGQRDRLDCGPSRDRFRADRRDRVRRCELRR
jgi:Ca2+-binding RTX toxin-like protein